MLLEPVATAANMPMPLSMGPHSAKPSRGLAEERKWRSMHGLTVEGGEAQSILTSRWLDGRDTIRDEDDGELNGRYVVSIALRPVRITMTRHETVLFDGLMPAGMIHLSIPADGLRARFYSRCDFIHFHVSQDCFMECRDVVESDGTAHAPPAEDVLMRDILTERLGRTLIDGAVAGNDAYAETVGRTIIMRILALTPRHPRVSALSRWRLKRVQDYVSSHIEEKITLSDLAGAAGLSRMHFAAQFKIATGFSPHGYVQHRRIESAKETMIRERMPLAHVALGVGFQAQAHFTTVFKKLTGDTPARWREARLDQGWPIAASPSEHQSAPNVV